MAPPAFVTNPSPSLVAAPNAVPREFRARDAAASIPIKSPPRQRHLIWPTRASVEQVLRTVWLAASVGLVTFYALLWQRLRMAARSWRRERINDQDVWVTEALGPAVYGLIKPVILMPRWALDVDCDARVLGRGAEARAYGEVLLAIGERRTFTPVGAIALTEPASQLLRRIRIMTTHLPLPTTAENPLRGRRNRRRCQHPTVGQRMSR
jgi:beta-lactamase regulating signal transducer with metallopeptidase domain